MAAPRTTTRRRNPDSTRAKVNAGTPKRKTPDSMTTSPHAITDEHAEIVESALREGASWSDAARRAGIWPQVLTSWRNEVIDTIAHPDVSLLPQAVKTLVARGEIAVAEYRHELAASVARAADKEWRAASWLLSKSDPEQWGERSTVEVRSSAISGMDDRTAAMVAWGMQLVEHGLTLPDGTVLSGDDLLQRYAMPAPVRAVAAVLALHRSGLVDAAPLAERAGIADLKLPEVVPVLEGEVIEDESDDHEAQVIAEVKPLA